MPTHPNSTTVKEAFFHLIELSLTQATSTRPCPELPDPDWIRMGVQRVLEGCESGRAFLQEHGLRFDQPPTLGNYFASLRSRRRGQLAREVSLNLVGLVDQRLSDRLADIPELAGYACFACDGHWHKAATHDPRYQGTKMAVGHFYSLNLRTHSLRHLAAGQGLHEHDMSALKRIKPKGLRQAVPRGTRVLTIYDKAGVDFGYWKRCRQECAVYFISRLKDNLCLAWEADRPWDPSDARNRGVVSDLWVSSREGHRLRLITYVDPQSGKVFEFLTNEPDLPPGVVAELYRRRWEAEKVFDEVKNKLGQKKAWATSLAAKETQAHLIAITHNLLLCYEATLESRHGLQNNPEDQRRRQRVKSAARECARTGSPLSVLVMRVRKATQRSVKFIRWIRRAIREECTEAAALAHLRHLYAVM
ncbi:MAG: transposase [Verrucomicrobia bacterium]|nr:transposase [Verrucomicrobiota bacterium]